MLATWLGEEPELPSVLLNGHYDVVPSEDEQWTLGDPWAAGTTDDGATIVGRGTQGEPAPSDDEHSKHAASPPDAPRSLTALRLPCRQRSVNCLLSVAQSLLLTLCSLKLLELNTLPSHNVG